MNNPENKDLPAILIGGAPCAGKSVLTYHLTQRLREKEIPHYVFRANPDGEGDWFLKGNDIETVRQLRTQAHRDWSDEFRWLVCRDLPRRQLPLIVDIGGCPKEKDNCILRACTHSLLLLKDGEEEANETWRYFTMRTGLIPLAELSSQKTGTSQLISREPVITGTIAGLERCKPFHKGSNEVFEALAEGITKLFTQFSETDLEKLHLSQAPTEMEAFPVLLQRYLRRFAPGEKEWTLDQLEQLFPEMPSQMPLALYGRGPSWLYGALALYGDPNQRFYQFDPRFAPGWVEPLELKSSPIIQVSQKTITLQESVNSNAWMLTILLTYGYIDYETEAGELIFPDPPPDRGVIISGKLPLWLFTSLARFYVQRRAPWIAFHDANDNLAYVIYSQADAYTIGDGVPLPV